MEEARQDRGEMTALENEAVESIRPNQIVADNLNKEFETNLTPGARIARRAVIASGPRTIIR